MSQEHLIHEADSKTVTACSKGTPDSLSVLNTQPPEASSGINDATELLTAVHHVDSESSILSDTIQSSRTTFEMWYENEEIDFYYIFNDDEEEKHYRRQLSGYYSGIDIEQLTLPKNKFININEGESIAMANLGLTHHFFEPITMADSDGGDPYKPLLNEIDSKSDTKMLLQVVYRAQADSWKNMYGDSLRNYGQRLEQSGQLEERLFGLYTRDINDESKRDSAAQQIRSQLSHPAFYCEARILVISESEETAQRELSSIVDLIERNYSGKTGQKLSPTGIGCSAEEFLGTTITRDFFSPSGPPSGLLGGLKPRVLGTEPYMILTAPELAALCHLPSEDSIGVSGINYTPALVEGTLPPEAKEFNEDDFEMFN